MTAETADEPGSQADSRDPRDEEPALRHRPLGILVVVALGIGRLIIEVTQLVTARPSGFLEWIVGGSTIPTFELGTPAWYVGRVAIVVIIAITLASIVGLWRYRTWGWTIALIAAGLILALDLGWWIAGQPRYPGMFLNMVAVFYLNQREVRAVFLPRSL